uniref:PRESAN domain-containing protein n=2 Tax=Bursaphelenchus xylophilus TaxID=6326 RepID=A0A1I7RS65_BURXY
MVRRLYASGLVLASISVVCGFYILAGRDDLLPLQEDSEFVNIPEEYRENLPEFDVLPTFEEEDSDDEDENELIDRTLRLRKIIQDKEDALRLAEEYNQLIRPEDFVQAEEDDSGDVEFIPVPRRRAVYYID